MNVEAKSTKNSQPDINDKQHNFYFKVIDIHVAFL